jgi:PAS domain-containing protein
VQTHNLVLILARDFASRLATPTALFDPDGAILYFNEAAESVLGQRYVEGERIPQSTLIETLRPADDEGRPLPADRRPIGIVLGRRQPAHGAMHVTSPDGVDRSIEVTAFPLFARADEFVGAIAIFWEHDGDAGAGSQSVG